MALQLLPCPFCGGPVEEFLSGYDIQYSYIECRNEDCEVQPSTTAMHPFQAYRAWNARAQITNP